MDELFVVKDARSWSLSRREGGAQDKLSRFAVHLLHTVCSSAPTIIIIVVGVIIDVIIVVVVVVYDDHLYEVHGGQGRRG